MGKYDRFFFRRRVFFHLVEVGIIGRWGVVGWGGIVGDVFSGIPVVLRFELFSPEEEEEGHCLRCG